MRRYLLLPDGQVLEMPDPISTQDIPRVMGTLLVDTVILTRKNGQADLVMLVDDNGHVKGLPFNQKATDLYHSVCIPGTLHEIVGPVFICPDSDFADI